MKTEPENYRFAVYQIGPFYEMLNLLSIFNYLGITKGVELVQKRMIKNHPFFKEFIEENTFYQNSIKKLQINIVPIHKSIIIQPFFDFYKTLNCEKLASEKEAIEQLVSAIYSEF